MNMLNLPILFVGFLKLLGLETGGLNDFLYGFVCKEVGVCLDDTHFFEMFILNFWIVCLLLILSFGDSKAEIQFFSGTVNSGTVEGFVLL